MSSSIWPPESWEPNPFQMYVRVADDDPGLQIFSCKQTHSKWAEALVTKLYALSGWTILHQRFRIRGSEIDLAVCNFQKKTGRIIEVKSRISPGPITAPTIEPMLSHKKQKGIRLGSHAILDRFVSKTGLHFSWSFDLVLVLPHHQTTHHLICTWANALELG